MHRFREIWVWTGSIVGSPCGIQVMAGIWLWVLISDSSGSDFASALTLVRWDQCFNAHSFCPSSPPPRQRLTFCIWQLVPTQPKTFNVCVGRELTFGLDKLQICLPFLSMRGSFLRDSGCHEPATERFILILIAQNILWMLLRVGNCSRSGLTNLLWGSSFFFWPNLKVLGWDYLERYLLLGKSRKSTCSWAQEYLCPPSLFSLSLTHSIFSCVTALGMSASRRRR